MSNQLINWLKNNPKIILAVVIVLVVVAVLIFAFQKSFFGARERDPKLERPDETGENFLTPAFQGQPEAAEKIKKTTPPRDKKGRFVKQTRSQSEPK